jgi:hypothetical protein
MPRKNRIKNPGGNNNDNDATVDKGRNLSVSARFSWIIPTKIQDACCMPMPEVLFQTQTPLSLVAFILPLA